MVVSKGKLKARMLEYFREVERTGEPLIVTDNGREVLEVRAIRSKEQVDDVLAEIRGLLFSGSRSTADDATLMEPAIRAGDESDDSWWTGPEEEER